MKVGDLVKHFLTEQIGIVINLAIDPRLMRSIQVVWTTQGESLFGPGNKEWCAGDQLEVLTTA